MAYHTTVHLLLSLLRSPKTQVRTAHHKSISFFIWKKKSRSASCKGLTPKAGEALDGSFVDRCLIPRQDQGLVAADLSEGSRVLSRSAILTVVLCLQDVELSRPPSTFGEGIQGSGNGEWGMR